jgi:hypothetical protein
MRAIVARKPDGPWTRSWSKRRTRRDTKTENRERERERERERGREREFVNRQEEYPSGRACVLAELINSARDGETFILRERGQRVTDRGMR